LGNAPSEVAVGAESHSGSLNRPVFGGGNKLSAPLLMVPRAKQPARRAAKWSRDAYCVPTACFKETVQTESHDPRIETHANPTKCFGIDVPDSVNAQGNADENAGSNDKNHVETAGCKKPELVISDCR